MTLAPGTLIEGSTDPRTVEQNAAIRAMQTESGEVGSQYSGCIILPDGTVTRDVNVIVKPPARVTEINNVLNAAGKQSTVYDAQGNARQVTNGGYLLILNTDGIPVQYLGVSASSVQTTKEQVMGRALSPAEAAQGYTRKTAIALAMQGVQTDGTAVTDSYNVLMAQWARELGVAFTPASAETIAAATRPAPASVVVTSGQGIAATPVGKLIDYAKPDPSPMQNAAPIFTQGAILQEDFTPAVLRSPTYVPTQSTTAMPTMLAAESETAPATSPAQDGSVAAKSTMLKYAALGVLALALAYAMGRK